MEKSTKTQRMVKALTSAALFFLILVPFVGAVVQNPIPKYARAEIRYWVDSISAHRDPDQRIEKLNVSLTDTSVTIETGDLRETYSDSVVEYWSSLIIRSEVRAYQVSRGRDSFVVISSCLAWPNGLMTGFTQWLILQQLSHETTYCYSLSDDPRMFSIAKGRGALRAILFDYSDDYIDHREQARSKYSISEYMISSGRMTELTHRNLQKYIH